MKGNKTVILHAISTLNIGGAEILVKNILINLDTSKFETHLLLIEHVGPLIPEVEHAGVKIHSIKAGKIRYNPFMLWEIVRLIKTEKIDIVHVHLYKSALYVRLAAFIARCKKIIFHEHGGLLHKPWRHRISNFVLQFITDINIFISEHDKSYFSQHDGLLLSKRKKIINNPCVISDTYKKSSPNIVTIGMVGQLSLLKGHCYAFKAFAMLQERNYKFNYILYGEGEQRNNLMQYAKKLKIDVAMPGVVCNIRNVFEKIDLLIHPSISEGFGMVIVEAMAFGIPVIASNTGGIPDIIKHGQNGLLVEPRDTNAICDSIIKLHDDVELRSSISREAFVQSQKNYNLKDYISKIESIYLA